MTDRAKAKERDEVLKRMLKMKPRPHKDDSARSATLRKPKRAARKSKSE